MSLGFLGGIAGAYQAIQRGVDDSKRRDDLDKRRQWQEEDRSATLEEREFQRSERARTLRDRGIEDKRQEGLREATRKWVESGSQGLPQPAEAMPMAGAQQGDTALKTPAVEQQPGDTSAPMPGAQTAEAAPPAQAPAPAAPAGNQAAAPKKRYTYAQYLRDIAKANVDGNRPDQAAEAMKQAETWTLKQASQQLNSIMASAASMQPDQLATAVTEMFNSDPLPTQVKSLKANADGSFTGVVYGTDSGKEMPVNFKNAAEMLQGLQSYYQPETFAKLQQAAAEARAKAREELYKPRTLKPGETFQAFNPTTGKFEILAEGKIPPGYEVVEGPNGETLLRKFDATGRGASGASGAGGKTGKVEDPLKAVNDAFELAATKGESKLMPNQIAQGRRIAQDLARNGVDGGLAVEVAIDIVNDPSKAQLGINYTTGEVDLTYRNPRVNRGAPIKVSPGAGTLEEIEKSEGGVERLKQEAAGLLDHMVSAVPVAGRDAARQQLISIASNPEVTRQYLEAASAAGKDVAAISRQLDLVRRYAPAATQQKSGGPAKTVLEMLRGAAGGIAPKTDPNSPAGRFQARQQQERAAASERSSAESKAVSDLSAQFNKDKLSMEPLEFARKYDAVRMKLNAADAAELRRIEKGL